MKRWHPLNWIQWLTLALALFTVATVIVLFLRLEHVQQRIQQERRDSIRVSCEDQNHRHDATLKQLNSEGAAAIKKHPDGAAQIRKTVDQFKLIFDASTPHRNCRVLVDRFAHQGG